MGALLQACKAEIAVLHAQVPDVRRAYYSHIHPVMQVKWGTANSFAGSGHLVWHLQVTIPSWTSEVCLQDSAEFVMNAKNSAKNSAEFVMDAKNLCAVADGCRPSSCQMCCNLSKLGSSPCCAAGKQSCCKIWSIWNGLPRCWLCVTPPTTQPCWPPFRYMCLHRMLAVRMAGSISHQPSLSQYQHPAILCLVPHGSR